MDGSRTGSRFAIQLGFTRRSFGHHSREEKTNPDPWPVIKKLLRHYVGAERRAGQGFYKHPEEWHEAVVRRSQFRGLEILTVPFERTRFQEEIIGYLHSTSFASRRILGTEVAEFERELRQALANLNPSACYLERGEVQVILARK